MEHMSEDGSVPLVPMTWDRTMPDNRLYIHLPCRQVEWWNEAAHGPVNDQGCDVCESAPDGKWKLLYVEWFVR